MNKCEEKATTKTHFPVEYCFPANLLKIESSFSRVSSWSLRDKSRLTGWSVYGTWTRFVSALKKEIYINLHHIFIVVSIRFFSCCMHLNVLLTPIFINLYHLLIVVVSQSHLLRIDGNERCSAIFYKDIWNTAAAAADTQNACL